VRHAALFILMAIGYAGPCVAQGQLSECGVAISRGSGSEAKFIDCAREGTARYQDRTFAIQDGYRMIGSDFPAMGEHWINISLLFDGEFDPERPEVLNYIVISGEPKLLGVAYAMPLLGGESAPDWPTSGAWHDHYRTLDDETTAPEHHLSGEARNHGRLSMLHAWIWADNPEGVFAADNWSIPYLRLGIPPPDVSPGAAARALSLLSAGAVHFMGSIEGVAAPSPDEKLLIEIALADATAEVDRVIRNRDAAALNVVDTARLSEVWSRLWNAIGNSIDDEALSRFCPESDDREQDNAMSTWAVNCGIGE
jgi:hypothetical protein